MTQDLFSAVDLVWHELDALTDAVQMPAGTLTDAVQMPAGTLMDAVQITASWRIDWLDPITMAFPLGDVTLPAWAWLAGNILGFLLMLSCFILLTLPGSRASRRYRKGETE